MAGESARPKRGVAYLYARKEGCQRLYIGPLLVDLSEDADAALSRVKSTAIGNWFETVEIIMPPRPAK